MVVDDRSGQFDRLSPAGCSQLDYGRSWSSQEWKREATAHGRSGKLDEISWNEVRHVCPHHEEPLLDTLFSTEMRNPKGTGGYFVIDQSNLIRSTFNKWQIPKFSSWVKTQQNLRIKVKDQVRKKTEKECRTLQILEKNILLFGECSWL